MIIKSEKLSNFDNQLIHGTAVGVFLFALGHKKEVLDNRGQFVDQLGIDLADLVFVHQIHGDQIKIVDTKYKGAGVFSRESYIKFADGLITNRPGVFLGIFTSDCLPVLLYDPVKKIAAGVHIGYKGILNKIVFRLIEAIKENYQSRPGDLIVYAGPCVGRCCYEVSQCHDDRIKNFEDQFNNNSEVLVRKNDLVYLDLKQAATNQFLSLGVAKENLEISNVCTYCDQKNLPSHRREGDSRKRSLLSVIGIKNSK